MKMITINGSEVINLLPENARQGALVDMSTLKRLTDLLPEQSFYGVKQNVSNLILQTQSVEEMCDVMADELAFQHTVNVINEIDLKELEVEKHAAKHNL